MTPIVFRLRGSDFTTTAFISLRGGPGPYLAADVIARSCVAFACQRLGGVAPSQLELIQ